MATTVPAIHFYLFLKKRAYFLHREWAQRACAFLNSRQSSLVMPLLDVRHLTTRFHTHHGVVYAVEDVSFSVDFGQTLGIFGDPAGLHRSRDRPARWWARV